jgi:hypothetical protein
MNTIQSQEKLEREWESALLATAAIFTITVTSTLIMVYAIFAL